MKAKLSLLLLVLITLCLSTTKAASTIKYQYHYSDDDGDPTTNTEPLQNAGYLPVYDLGILQAGWTIRVTINVPNIVTTSIVQQVLAVTSALLWFEDNSDPTAIAYAPAVTDAAGTLLEYDPTIDLDTSGTTMTKTYTIVFPETFTGTSANFKLGWLSTSPTPISIGTIRLLAYISIAVDYFNGTGSSVASSEPAQTLLKVTETGRQSVIKVFYVAPSSSAFQFAFFPFAVDTATAVAGDFIPGLYSIDLDTATSLTANQWALTAAEDVMYTDAASTTAAPFDLESTVEYFNSEAGITDAF